MKVTLGIDVACRADHQASLADERGEFLWSGVRFRTRVADLDQMWARVPPGAEVTVVLEPTRNAWAALASWFTGRGARVVMVPSTQSADLRAYYCKHTKNDRLDSRVLARLPLLHPDGLRPVSGDGPGDPLRRAARRRASLGARRTAVMARLDALVELLGPAWYEALGSDYEKTSLAVLAHYPNPEQLLRLGRARLETFLRRWSRGHWGRAKAEELRAAARESIAVWDGGMDFTALAEDIRGVSDGLCKSLSAAVPPPRRMKMGVRTAARGDVGPLWCREPVCKSDARPCWHPGLLPSSTTSRIT